ncbi:MAG: nicotinate-nucleotide adenylyltransferase [Candidatus Omnitrophica bacterium]|nr:nicotinate-nucleotide adenylyltransferase [Candidatus Omnitrophota bacterium]
MRKVGILGGTFNPVHVGHLVIAQRAAEVLELDKVIFVPCAYPPHKEIPDLVEGRDRLAMVKIAIEDNKLFSFSDFEVNRPGKSYSIDTVNYLKKSYPENTKFYFIIGADGIKDLHTWKNVDELKRNVTFIAVNRLGYKRLTSRITVKAIDMVNLEISSSYIRSCIKEKKSVRYLVPDEVISYIRKKKLYI